MEYRVTHIYVAAGDDISIDELITRHRGQIRDGHPITIHRDDGVRVVLTDERRDQPSPRIVGRAVTVEQPCRRCTSPTYRRITAKAEDGGGNYIVAECWSCSANHPEGIARRADALPWDEGNIPL